MLNLFEILLRQNFRCGRMQNSRADDGREAFCGAADC